MAPAIAARPLVEAVKVSKPFPKDALWAQKKGPISEAQILAKHPHAIPGTRQYDVVARKWAMTIQCACGATRIVYTSDLHHVRTCRACKAKADAAKVAVAVQA
jgi:hypothetical protein